MGYDLENLKVCYCPGKNYEVEPLNTVAFAGQNGKIGEICLVQHIIRV